MPNLLSDPGYAGCIQTMLKAARVWLALHGAEGLSFTLPPAEVMLIGNLDGSIVDALAPGEVARRFLRSLDVATGEQATAYQACLVVRALELPIVEGVFTLAEG